MGCIVGDAFLNISRPSNRALFSLPSWELSFQKTSLLQSAKTPPRLLAAPLLPPLLPWLTDMGGVPGRWAQGRWSLACLSPLLPSTSQAPQTEHNWSFISLYSSANLLGSPRCLLTLGKCFCIALGIV